MRVVIIGKGDIGTAVINELKDIGALIVCSRSSRAYPPVDISDKKLIEALFKKIGHCDHIVSAAGKSVPTPFKESTIVSPDLLEESLDRYGRENYKDIPIVPAKIVGKAYRELIKGSVTGKVVRVEAKI